MKLKSSISIRIFLGLILAGLIYWIYKQHLLHISFVDEEDYFLIGKYLSNGAKLYSGYFGHHQPGAYVISALIQKLTRPNTIYLLVKRHRQFIAFWSMGWCFFLTIKYGVRGFLACLSIEILSIMYLRNLFLPESMVLYPLLFGAGQVFEKRNINWLWGLSIAWLVIMLAPLWPVAGLMLVAGIWKFRKNKKDLLTFLISVSLPCILLLPIIDIRGYWKDVIYTNLVYYIPKIEDGSTGLLSSLSKLIVAPFKTSLTSQEIIIELYILAFWASMVRLIFKKKYKMVVGIVIGLFLIDSRGGKLDKILFDGFHMFLLVGTIIWIGIMHLPKILLAPIVGLILINSYQLKDSIWRKRDLANDYYINYSQQIDLGDAVKIMANTDNRLLVIPDKPLIYWHSGVEPASRFIFYYKWMNGVASFRKEIIDIFENNVVDFLVYPNNSMDLPGIEKYLGTYVQAKKNSEYVNLYVKKDIIDDLSEEKITKLNYYNFEF